MAFFSAELVNHHKRKRVARKLNQYYDEEVNVVIPVQDTSVQREAVENHAGH